MADFQVILPPLGDDAPAEAKVSFFYVQEGDRVNEGDDFCEMIMDKAAFNVPAPCTGKVMAIKAQEDETVKVGALLAIVETG